jgi:hypothetical protein
LAAIEKTIAKFGAAQIKNMHYVIERIKVDLIRASLKEIERGRGTAFDTAVVAACLRLFAQKQFAFSA